MDNQINPYAQKIKTLDDVADMSRLGAAAIEILRKHMKTDSSHDEGHIVRVVRDALWFSQDGDVDVIVPSAILHDLVNLPKDSPDRHLASRYSAVKAISELETATGKVGMTPVIRLKVINAIEAHSWSANIPTLFPEAAAVQDADRIDSLGCIGIARLFATGGAMRRTLFHPTDPLAKKRDLDELTYSLDHYFVKLKHLPDTMKTEIGKREAQRRLKKMETFIEGLIDEL
jgi:uncharacterized protein